MFCIHCGAKLSDGSRFCTACGRPTAPPEPPSSGDDFPDLENLAVHSASLQPPPEFDPTVRGDAAKAPDEPTHPIMEQIAPPPRYDDLDGPPVAPAPAPKKGGKRTLALIAAAALCVCVIVAALISLQPWRLLANEAGNTATVSSDATDASDSVPNLPRGAVSSEIQFKTDWSAYNGTWSAGNAVFTLLYEDGELDVTMQQGGASYWDAARVSDTEDMADLLLGGEQVRIKPGNGDTLRIAIAGTRYDAERYRAPAAEASGDPPAPAAADGGYLYYSASTGTRSTGDTIPENDANLHFWPLDQFAISPTDLDRLTRDEIDTIRNEAFARHGYIFTTERWQRLFGALSWYTPDPNFTEARFSKIEKQNLDTIVLYEREKGWM